MVATDIKVKVSIETPTELLEQFLEIAKTAAKLVDQIAVLQGTLTVTTQADS